MMDLRFGQQLTTNMSVSWDMSCDSAFLLPDL
jgi:hypothetical protein